MVEKRRLRLTRSCTFCKLRKIKCDLKEPCSSCVKYGRSECIYLPFFPRSESNDKSTARKIEYEKKQLRNRDNEKIKTQISMLESRLNDLKLKVFEDEKSTIEDNIYSSASKSGKKGQRINLHDVYYDESSDVNRLTGKGPLSWDSLLKSDAGLSYAWNCLDKNGDIERIHHIVKTNTDAKSQSHGFRNFLLPEYGKASNSGLNTYMAEKFTDQETIDATFYKDTTLILKEEILRWIPDQKKTEFLIDRFFSHVYAHVQMIDEQSFRHQLAKLFEVQRVLINKPYDKHAVVEVDVAFLGVLLIILRLAYLSLSTGAGKQNNLNSSETSVVHHTLACFETPISEEFVQLARCCLNRFDLSNNCELLVFQLALMLRLYKTFGPEEGDGVDSSNCLISFSKLFEMAYSMGLERDPENDDGDSNLRRKLWFALIKLDITYCIFTGAPVNSSRYSFDTKFPEDHFSGQRMPTIHIGSHSKYNYMVSLLKLVTDVNGADSSILISEFERAEDKFIDFKTFINSLLRDDTSKESNSTLRLKVYLNAISVLITIHFRVYLFYERNGEYDSSSKYLGKLLSIIKNTLVCSHIILDDGPIIFSGSSDLFVIPVLLISVHKSLIVLSALFTKMNLVLITEKYAVEENKVHKGIELVKKMYFSLIRDVEVLSKKYFYAFVIISLHNSIWDVINSRDFYNKLSDTVSNVVPIEIENSVEFSEEIDRSIRSRKSSASSDEVVGQSFTIDQLRDMLLASISVNSFDRKSILENYDDT